MYVYLYEYTDFQLWEFQSNRVTLPKFPHSKRSCDWTWVCIHNYVTIRYLLCQTITDRYTILRQSGLYWRHWWREIIHHSCILLFIQWPVVQLSHEFDKKIIYLFSAMKNRFIFRHNKLYLRLSHVTFNHKWVS